MKNYINRLRLRGKFLLISVGMLLPIAMLAVIAIRLEVGRIITSHSEGVGLDWAAPLMDMAGDLAEYREHAVSIAAGAAGENSELDEHRGRVRAAADRLDALAAQDERMRTLADWAALGPRVRAALEGNAADADQVRGNYLLIDALHAQARRVAEETELTLDPGADTYPLMYASLFSLPHGIESLASARRMVEQMKHGESDVNAYRELAAHAAAAKVYLVDGLHLMIDSYGAEAPDARSVALARELQPQVEKALRVLDADGRGGVVLEQAAELSGEFETLTESLATLRAMGADELEVLLGARTRNSVISLVAESLVVLLCLFAAFWIQRAVARQVSSQLHLANGVFRKLARGEFDSEIGEQAPDELGQLLLALGGMQAELAGRVEADRVAAERERQRAVASERIRQALDASSVNVVVADEHHQIIHLNPAAQALMDACQADFRQARSSFNASQLRGADLNVFFAPNSPVSQQLLDLRQPLRQEMVVGGRVMHLIASPILDGEGRRIGTVIEWQERTQEVAAEKEIGALVEAVADGQLTERISVQGKSGFFEVLAKGLNGLVGTVSEVVSDIRALVTGANDGDLTRRLPLEGKPGLYVSLGSGVNSLVGNMADMVARVKGMAGEVHQGAEEISRGNTNLSQRTEEQASSLEETASSMEEMTSTVRQTADNASQANQLAVAACDQAEKGGKVVSEAIAAMSGINDASRKIADIIGVIDEIAFQTNLLALNAAVEAARAGEQGRGFAVVATEVRSLAGRSATAAKEIKALIQDSVIRVEAGSKLVNDSGHTLQEIVVAVNKVTDIVADIAAASREQSSGIEQVNKAVMQMDTNTQQNAALVEQAAAASEAIAEQAQALNTLVSRYRVPGASERPRLASVTPVQRRAVGTGSASWREH